MSKINDSVTNSLIGQLLNYHHSNAPTFIPGKSWVPVSSPELNDNDLSELIQCVLGRWYTEGRYCKDFSGSLAKVMDKDHCQLVNSGSSASLVAMLAACEGHKNKLVVTTALGFPTTVAPIYQSGNIPYFIDTNPDTLAPDYDQLYEVITGPNSFFTDIIGGIFTHTLGFPFDEGSIRYIMGDKKFIIIDACDALGSSMLVRGELELGHTADICTLSFFPAHHITCAEGGAALTSNDKYAEKMRKLANWHRSCYCLPGQQNVCGKRFCWEDRGLLPEGFDHKYIFDGLGYNLKMTEFQAALGWSQLQRLDEFTFKRRWNFGYLQDNIRAIFTEDEIRFVDIPEWSLPSPFGLPIMVEETAPFTASDLIQFLESRKVATRRLFAGNLTKQPGFMNLPRMSKDLSGTDEIMERMFWIGCAPILTMEMLNYVISVFGDFRNGSV